MDYLLIKFCKLTYKILTFFHMGSSFPGRIALKINKNVLKKLSDKYHVILVTGTNGKTTTSSILAKILKDAGHSVIHNASGGNMLCSIITLFIAHESDKNKEIAVVEIDEANVPLYTAIANADYIVCTNIFKDQLDRYGEIYTTLNKIKSGIEKRPNIKMVLNGDEPMFGLLEGKRLFYGFENNPYKDTETKSNVEGKLCINCRTKYEYDFYTYNHLGKFYCPKCGYKRPELDYKLSNLNIIDDDHMELEINNDLNISANIGGMYNAYNILAAVSMALEIGVPNDVIEKSMTTYKARFGRTESFNYNGKEIKIILVKNPAGFNQGLMVPTYNREDKCGCFILNDNYADGRDVSWIWDVDFERAFTNYKKLYTAGIRKEDMAIRLDNAGYNIDSSCICSSIEDLVEKIKSEDECKYIYIFATYTSMLQLRKILAKQKIVEYSW